MQNKQLRDAFIPFHFVSSTVYLSIVGVWIGLFAILWWMAPVLIPSPLEVGSQLFTFLKDPDFYTDVISSIVLTVEGMVLSILIASFLGYLSVIRLFRPLSYFVVKLRYMSIAGFMYAFTLLIHGAGKVQIALLILGVVPFFTLTILSMLEKIEQKEFDLWTTLRYNRWEQLFQIVIRGKADVMIEAIRSNFAMAWLMIIMVETYSMASGGVGILLFKAAGKTQIDKVFALQLCILCLGVGFDYALRELRYALFPHIKLAEKR